MFTEELSVGDKGSGVNKGFENVVHERHYSRDLSAGEESFWTPGREGPHEFEIGGGLVEGGGNDHGELFLVLFVFFGELVVLLFFFELFVLVVVFVGFVETVGGIGHDHVEELFKHGQLKVLSQVGPVDLVVPERSEYFIDVEPVLEF